MLRWTRGREDVSSVRYTISLSERRGTLRLSDRAQDLASDSAHPIELIPTGCHLGGRRWWFVCPLRRDGVACGRRVRKLYLGSRYFGCRHGHALAYSSTQHCDARVYAALRGVVGLTRSDNLNWMNVGQIVLAIKVSVIAHKRFERSDRRFQERLKGTAAHPHDECRMSTLSAW
jgi:hypothetical protein